MHKLGWQFAIGLLIACALGGMMGLLLGWSVEVVDQRGKCAISAAMLAIIGTVLALYVTRPRSRAEHVAWIVVGALLAYALVRILIECVTLL